MSDINTKDNFFSFKGRIRRSTFGIRLIAFYIGVFISYFLISIGTILAIEIFATILPESTPGVGVFILLILLFILYLIVFIAYIMQIVKRLHDLDKEEIWAILIFVPLVSVIFLLYLIFTDGTVGPNRYGEDPKGRTPY